MQKGNPFTASGKLISYSIKQDGEATNFHYFSDIDFLTELREQFQQTRLIVGFNVKFDLHWARRAGLRPNEKCRIWDCQLAEFILTGQKGTMPALNDVLAKYGLGQKDDKTAEYWDAGIDTEYIPVDELRVYNNLDVDLTYKLYLKQQEILPEALKKLCLVMGLDLLVLADMEWNGVKFDKDLCGIKAEETQLKLVEVTEELCQYLPYPSLNFNSGHQLSCALYGGAFEVVSVSHTESLVYKSGNRKGQSYEKNHYVTDVVLCPQLFQPLKGSETKLVSKVGEAVYPVYATGEDILKQLKRPTKKHRRIIELLLHRAELSKLLDTYYGKLPQLLDTMEWGEYIHGQYNQCVAATGRLSSSAPNMQNFSGQTDRLLITRYDT